jgi:hypothetical protein
MTDMTAAPVAVIVCPSTDAASDATWVASLLSRDNPLPARDFARAMAKRGARDIELDRHDHWRRVAALPADHAPVRVRAPKRVRAPVPDTMVPGSTGPIAVPYQRRAHLESST